MHLGLAETGKLDCELDRVKRLWKLNHIQMPGRKHQQRRRGLLTEQYPMQAIFWSLYFVADRLWHGV